MSKHKLLIRETDRKVFEALKDGSKRIETRAATKKYQKIKPGDLLVFICGEDKLEKKVGEVKFFDSIEKMTGEVGFKQIMPFVGNVEEMRKVYFSFPGYEKKIKEFGLIVFFLS